MFVISAAVKQMVMKLLLFLVHQPESEGIVYISLPSGCRVIDPSYGSD